MPTTSNPYNRRAFVARLVGETLFDARTVSRVLDGDETRPSTVAAVTAAARRLGLEFPTPARFTAPVTEAADALQRELPSAPDPKPHRRGKGSTRRHNARRRAALANAPTTENTDR